MKKQFIIKMSNIPFLIFNYIEFNIVLLIINMIIVKYLAERKGWDGSYEKSYVFVSIWSLFYFTLLLLVLEIPLYIFDIHMIDINIIDRHIIIANVLIFIIDIVFATLLFKIIYKKEFGVSFIFVLLLVIFKNIIIFGLGLLFFPITSFIQSYP
ncbi:MAG: hypothetical protein ACFE9T_07425 [Promethearchaeota archaeon]